MMAENKRSSRTSGDEGSGPGKKSVRKPASAIRSVRGFTYTGLLIVLIVIGISLGAAGKYWQNVVLRDKEEELLFRGDQYRIAIERYYYSLPGRPQYPPSIDDLLQDGRTAVGKRHLRRKYLDPMTGEDFELVRDQLSKRITGVYSKSEKTPLKQANFPDQYVNFEGKEKYSDWQFLAMIQTALTSTARPRSQAPTTK